MEKQTENRTEKRMGRPMRIVAVDNDLFQLNTIEKNLKEAYPLADVRTFLAPSQALDFLLDKRAELAILETRYAERMDGLQLAMQCRDACPDIRILFYTSYKEYALDAFQIHADGYLCKPVTGSRFKNEVSYLLDAKKDTGKPFIRTFDGFEVFADGKPVVIRRRKSKEMLAVLTDRRGAWVPHKEMGEILWENYEYNVNSSKYLCTLANDLAKDLKAAGIPQIIERKRGKERLCMNEVECDYYEYLNENRYSGKKFPGNYMMQYSWGKKRELKSG
ncbi:MAG: response regulator [Lachnospiraceae bacterium]|nr:response regulator [Lachnospiraceae bacterium]